MKLFNLNFNHSKLYYIGLILVAISLPLSKYTVNVSLIFLLCNWILEFDFKRKWNELKHNIPVLVFLGVFLVHIIWLLNTKNIDYAFWDLSRKYILLVYPVIIGTSEKLNLKQIKIILIWFILAVFVSTIISTLILFQIINFPIQNIRDISPFISHIRLSLLINASIFSLGYFLFSKEIKNSRFEIISYALIMVWLIIFLFLLKSLTGIIIFFVLIFIVLTFVSIKIKEIVHRLFLQVLLITVFLVIASLITHSVSKFYSVKRPDFESLETHTLNGNIYEHFTQRKQLENGNFVWLYVCEKEMENEWNKRSSISYSGIDKKGQSIKYTLIRYLTSKGYRKDSLGLSKLSEHDIRNIENGIANYIFENKLAIYPLIYDIIWQIDVYRKGYNPAGNSITLRFELAKTGLNIIKNNFWFGVGTGDVQDSFDKQYELNQSKLPQEYRLRAHNMFLTFLISFGIAGTIIIMFSIFYPVFKQDGFKNFLFSLFFLIALLSFLNEDTLETLIGVTFFSYFYSLFLFGTKVNVKEKKEYE